MQKDDTCHSDAINLQEASYLTSEGLLSLRKPMEAKASPAIGEKLYNASKTEVDVKALQSTLEDNHEVLEQKRAARICDLMQAEWNENSNVAITKKLKGKFVQHMGHAAEGKPGTALYPEEAVFLLENGHLEISHGGMPMSAEEAYAIILKGKLGIEKYQVYSHLSRLGFIVVQHQLQLGVTSYEKRMNLDKHKVKKKRKSDFNEEDKTIKKKNLNFTGCISSTSHTDFVSKTGIELSESNTPNPNKSLLTEPTEVAKISRNDSFASDNNSNLLNECELNVEVAYDKESSITVKESAPVAEPNSDDPNLNVKEVQSSTDIESVNNSSDVSVLNVELDNHEANSKTGNMEEISAVPGINGDEANQAKCSFEDSANAAVPDAVLESESDDDDDSTDESTDSEVREESNPEKNNGSSSDVFCIGAENIESDSIASTDSGKEHMLDDGIYFIEVKKKESKPLAVIDLLSDDEEHKNDKELNMGSDDDIQVIKVCSSSTNIRKEPSKKLALKNHMKCKSEGITRARTQVTSNMWPFPDLAGKELVCLPRPPAHLLPTNVRPAKEAYPLDLKMLFGVQQHRPPPQARLWNSYKDLQEHSRSRFRSRTNRYGNRRHEYDHSQSSNFAPEYERSRDRNNVHDYNPVRDHSNAQLPFSSRESPAVAPWQSVPNSLPSGNPFNSSMLMNQESLSQMLMKNAILQTNMNSNMFNLPSNRLAECVAEVQRTAYCVATSVLSSMFSETVRNSIPEYRTHEQNRGFAEDLSHLSPYEQQRSMFRMIESARNASSESNHENASTRTEQFGFPNAPSRSFRQNSQWGPSECQSRVFSDSQSYDPQRGFEGNSFGHRQSEYHSNYRNNRNMHSNEHRRYQRREFHNRHRNHGNYKQSVYPCIFPRMQNSHSWKQLKSTLNIQDETSRVDIAADVGADDEVEEVPININEVLWSRDISPLVRPGSQLPVADVLTGLKVTKTANLSEKSSVFERYLPSSCSLEISFDVYLPGSSYRKSCPGIPNQRIVVVRATDPFPKLSDMVFLQRKFNDGVFLQFAVVDNGDISYYSFNNMNLPSIVPHEQ